MNERVRKCLEDLGASRARAASPAGDGAARKDGFARFIRGMSWVVLSPFFAVRVGGRQHLPRDRSFLLLAKHQRWEDIPILAMSVPRPLYYVAKYELFGNALSDWFLRSVGGIPLNRSRPLESRRQLKHMVDLLHRGEGVVVFPEGTYFPHQMGPGQTGVIRLVAARVALPLVPVGIRYARGRGRTRVSVRIGDPILPPFPEIHRLVDEIMWRIALLSGLVPAAANLKPSKYRRREEHVQP